MQCAVFYSGASRRRFRRQGLNEKYSANNPAARGMVRLPTLAFEIDFARPKNREQLLAWMRNIRVRHDRMDRSPDRRISPYWREGSAADVDRSTPVSCRETQTHPPRLRRRCAAMTNAELHPLWEPTSTGLDAPENWARGGALARSCSAAFRGGVRAKRP